MRSKHAAFAVAAFVLAALLFPSLGMAAGLNSKPCLCQPTVTPMQGTDRSKFVAEVKYSDPDGDAAAKVEAYIDGKAYPMRLVRGKAHDGIYQAKLSLPPGEHNHYFYAEDVRGMSERFPRYGARTGPFVGTKKHPYNRIAMLTEGGVHYAGATNTDIYTYTVRYTDRDKCKPPMAVRVIVDGIPHDMKLHSGSANDGIYIYETMLTEGAHGYYFVARDAAGDCVTHPAHGFVRGPLVARQTNTSPVLSENDVFPNIGGTGTRFTYSVVYKDAEWDVPSLALIYVDGVPYELRHSAGKPYVGVYTFRSRQPLGDLHEYYYYFEDGKGGARRYPAVGAFHGPVVTR
jgi:hypothetical protein